MSLTPGTRLGAYEVVALLGAGGMGDVYRARDSKLDRHVAIKILPELFAHDPERLARFEREAKTLASLNHPNIAAIYGFEESNGVQALVLELVEGPTLADRIAQGPIPLDEALPIARQIAEALEAAHEHAIVHRDLKPANIKVKDDGAVKVLDFGLAKALSEDGATADLSQSPTISLAATRAGVILGTAAYMSPEQAKGRPVDKRSDVWAFGCVLYEMLTGRRTFEGADVSEVLAGVIKSEPDWSRLPADTPPHIRTLLRRCLQKDPQRRLPHIGVARLEIDEGPAEAVAAAARGEPALAQVVVQIRPLWRRAILVLAGVILASAVTSMAWWTFRSSTPLTISRFSFTLPQDQRFTNPGRNMVAISPDGTQMAYVANERLYLRSMSELEARPIPGTENTKGRVLNPVFSPDGQSIAFWAAADQTLKRIAVTGGVAVTICQVAEPFLGMSWGPDGIVFGQGSQGILRVSANGGTPERLVNVSGDEVAAVPQMLPGDQAVLFTLAGAGGIYDRWDKARIVVQSLKSGERKALLDGGSDARYLPTGHLVYALGGALFAVPFDLGRLEVAGGDRCRLLKA